MFCACPKKPPISSEQLRTVQVLVKLPFRNFANISPESSSFTAQGVSSATHNIKHEQDDLRRSKGSRTRRGMKSWQIHSYGGFDDLQMNENSRMPLIKLPTDVLIKVHSASVNPIDIAMTKGYGSHTINRLRNIDCTTGRISQILQTSTKNNTIEFPLTLGRDFSGVIAETGHNVTDFTIGDEVYGVLGVQRSGSHAEYTVASQDTIRRKPKNLSFSEAASVPYVGLTAWAAIKVTGAFMKLSQKKFLVLGGSGGVGTFAVQYLKAHGAHVVTTCSSDAISLMETLGSDFVIDYRQTDHLSQLKNFAPFDCVLDLSGPENVKKAASVTQYLRPLTGQYIHLSPPFLANIDKYGFVGGAVKNLNDIACDNLKSLSNHRVPTKWAFFIPNGSALESITDLIEAGRIKPVIHGTFNFSNLPAAYQKMEHGHLRGKIVIDIIQ